ncbi:uncharacterized protein MELLADRAFT_112294 [Melampsora larici-populina 98AG31]|uniref:Secreted protein n=1 Tax=Melampsora larici-populina (strain 98AG31 / pathotype 3-4-7) TaxID=747676 RepID=F4S612_MELLP|nr:uncharacterized protein MELLADRAFT_112294 [Melampsora larici-populina 98AG31]EGF99922.1 secreted protein [Melampsora larici-populina 98AG31]
MRRFIVLSLVLGIEVMSTICGYMGDTERLEVMGFSDTRRFRTSLEDGEDGRASERIDCQAVKCTQEDSSTYNLQGCGTCTDPGYCQLPATALPGVLPGQSRTPMD